MQQYKRLAGDKIILEIIDPEPFTVDEDAAVNYGLQAIPVDNEGNELYFGLVGTNSTTAKEVIPGIEKAPFDWLAAFEQVVSTGKSARFEQRLWPSNIWCDCIVFRYKPEHFFTVFINIAQRKQAEEAQANNDAQMQPQKCAAPVIKD